MNIIFCHYPKGIHVVQHDRNSHWVRGHFRGLCWIPAHVRSGSTVSEHCRS
ncbi:hypothetical protein [Paenibacillus radicis (ex Xue et al. 2023)]|uniref:Uncharacterized protein n=1 Tax=Paenibacillus radicis (ex Xue et al. 2023) TaxID=2972489 RepID=A0ABT1YVI1_9BACL|nr:hypothetical protein [Paenibacillus radicis (ex Xue et al. 2023)]MCR8636960.1 hypothetical protein [Paenibacillus radicis (ex Xue et al. 2023)]